MEATISEPFEDCDDTLVRRLSWSADGQFLVATNSKDGVRVPRVPDTDRRAPSLFFLTREKNANSAA